jgi:hypothetical protein
MDAEFAIRWAARLRDPELPQGKEYLRGADGYCCLGVAEMERGRTFIASEDERTDPSQLLNSERFLTKETQQAIGMFSIFGVPRNGMKVVIDGLEYCSLSYANDHGVPFSKIADWIEANHQHL